MTISQETTIIFPCPKYGSFGHDWLQCPDCQDAEARLYAQYQAECDAAEAEHGGDGNTVFTVQVLAWSSDRSEVQLYIEGLIDEEDTGWIPRPDALPPDTEPPMIFWAWMPERIETDDLPNPIEMGQKFQSTLILTGD